VAQVRLEKLDPQDPREIQVHMASKVSQVHRGLQVTEDHVAILALPGRLDLQGFLGRMGPMVGWVFVVYQGHQAMLVRWAI
jgi:hypothetical protein